MDKSNPPAPPLPLRIMIVDSSDVSRKLIARALHSDINDIQITACSTAKEALTHLKNWEKFDLITTSLMLKDMDGLDLCRNVRRIDRHRYTPVIVVSGDADARLLHEGFAAGVTDYFDKSKGYSELVDFIRGFSQHNTELKGRVLYVEDSLAAARVTQRIMQQHGLDVVHTTNAEEALEILVQAVESPAEEDHFDIVFTDFFLEGKLSGGDLLHAIRAMLHQTAEELPVLVITANADEKKQAEVFHAGANDFVTKPFIEEVLIARLRNLLLIRQQHKQLQRHSAELALLSHLDSLTGTYNKRYLVDHCDTLLDNPANHPISAIHLDIDQFHQINTHLGELTGDRILASVGKFLVEYFAESNHAIVIHHRTDEFIILLLALPAEQAVQQALKLHQALAEVKQNEVNLTVSMGLASSQDHPHINLCKLLALANEALHSAKRHGPHSRCVFTNKSIECLNKPVSTHSIFP